MKAAHLAAIAGLQQLCTLPGGAALVVPALPANQQDAPSCTRKVPFKGYINDA